MMAAASLVCGSTTNNHEGSVRGCRPPVDQPLGPGCLARPAARILAGCLQLGEPVRICREQGHGSEGPAEEVEVETGDDHVPASIGQLFCQVDDVGFEELGLVD